MEKLAKLTKLGTMTLEHGERKRSQEIGESGVESKRAVLGKPREETVSRACPPAYTLLLG